MRLTCMASSLRLMEEVFSLRGRRNLTERPSAGERPIWILLPLTAAFLTTHIACDCKFWLIIKPTNPQSH